MSILFSQFCDFYIAKLRNNYYTIFEVIEMNVGDRIKSRREELNMTVDELASLINKNRATVYRYEKGDIESLPTTVLKPLAKALRTTPEYLMGWEEDDSLGNYEENIDYLKDNYPNLVDLYNEIHANDQLVILFDKAKKLEPQDLAQILKIIDTFNKETK